MEKFYLAHNDKCFKCIFQNPHNQYLLGLLIEGVTGYKYRNMNYSNVEKNINMYIKRKYLDMNLDSKIYNPKSIRNRISSAKNAMMSADELEKFNVSDFDEKVVLISLIL